MPWCGVPRAGAREREPGPVIPVSLAPLCSSQGPRRTFAHGLRAPVSQNSTACGLVHARYARQVRQVSVDVPKDRARSSPAGRAAPTWKPVPWKGSLAGADPVAEWSEARRLLRRLPRKEVIQPQLPLRLPCYDFTPVTGPTFDGSLLAVGPPASGVAYFRGVTGGVYKARERIHRSNADLRLLATPPSCRRVSACNPNRDAL